MLLFHHVSTASEIFHKRKKSDTEYHKKQQISAEPEQMRAQISITQKAICLCDNSRLFQGAGAACRYCSLNALTLVVWGYVLFCQGRMSLVFSSGPYGGEEGWRQPSSRPTGIGELARPLISSYPCAWQRRGFRISTSPPVKNPEPHHFVSTFLWASSVCASDEVCGGTQMFASSAALHLRVE